MSRTAQTISVVLFGSVLFHTACTAAPQSVDEAPDTESSLIKNGSFDAWTDGKPDDWSIAAGIKNGADQPLSKLDQGDGSSLRLSGDAATLAWNVVSQAVDLDAGETYKLKFRARTKDLRRERNQYDNCHVGFWFTKQGQTIGNEVAHLASDEFKSFEINARVPDGCNGVNISIVLSKSGQLEVDDLKLEALSDVSSFDYLIDAMTARYSFFELKDIDPKDLAIRFREPANAATNHDEFAEVVADMLAELEDVHTWVIKDGKRFGKYYSSFTPNFNFDYVDSRLKFSRKLGDHAVVGLTQQGLGYVRITSLPVLAGDELKALQETIGKLSKAPGMIVDLRRNGGGDEPTAQAIAGLFADKEYVYAKHRARHQDGSWGEIRERVLRPVASKAYTKPIICLIGPGAVSSAEGFALMMKALDHCQTVGLPTRGASGNPAPVTLPNGVEVWFSRWISMETDGTPIEDRGVMPDKEVEAPQPIKGDPTFEAAVKLLKL